MYYSVAALFFQSSDLKIAVPNAAQALKAAMSMSAPIL